MTTAVPAPLAPRDAPHSGAEPVLDLWPVGDGRGFSRALARILVRRELISACVIADSESCEGPPTAG
jgi:hypothetical protein